MTNPELSQPNSLPALLTKVLSQTYDLYQRAHLYHWNIEGMNFLPLHEFFSTIYLDAFNSLDEIAERIRALGEKIQLPAGQYVSGSEVITSADMDARAMLQDVHQANQKLIAAIKMALRASEEENDSVSADMMTERLTILQKHQWMITSQLA